MTGIRLDGLDGSNPLAFLAALGTLRVLDDYARSHGRPRPRFSWIDDGVWRPVAHGATDLDEIVGIALNDHSTWSDEPAFRFAYSKNGSRVDPEALGAIRDLKPPPSVMAQLLEEVAERASQGDLRSARHAAAYGTDVATDRSGNTKPSALHFTAGQQSFLAAVADIHANLAESDVRRALAGPWTRSSTLKTLGWDPLGAWNARMYALSASDPSGDKRLGEPGAEWLAFVGLSFFPALPRGAQVLTTCISGGWKDSVMRWPLWLRPAAVRSVESLLRLPNLESMSSAERAARGIGVVYAASIVRSEQGGYGSFAPTSLAVGAPDGRVLRRSSRPSEQTRERASAADAGQRS